ncbi:hypothetical protein KAX75_12170 [candidate division WOR-3 bacterium]|nr:hypothetical protein [candidate division WOR-3 bacterium]
MARIKIYFILCVACIFTFLSSCKTVQISSGETQEIQNLRAFAKLYGYVKYFHPSDEASAIDWDKFAIYGVKKVKNAKDREELKVILEELFLPVGPTIQIYSVDERPRNFKEMLQKDTNGLKVVAWQHLGFGLGNRSLYKSMRLNRTRENQMRYWLVRKIIEAVEYRAKEIKLEAFVRANVTGAGNQGQLELCVILENGEIGFSDDMKDRPITSKKWQAYEIVGKVDDDAESILLGCFLSGVGQVWVDKIQLSIKNENSEWVPIEIENQGFEEEDENKKPLFWVSGGGVGYTGKITTENPYDGNRCLKIEYEGKLFEEYPKVGEVVDKLLDSGLCCQIPLALYSDENGTVGKDKLDSFDNFSSKLDSLSIDKLTADDEYLRLGDVVIAWNVFQHFYPYFDVVRVDWDKELTNFLKRAMTDETERDFLYTIRKLVARLQDGHGRVFHKIIDKQAGFPFLVDWIENQVIIVASEDTTKFKRGDIIVSIDGIEAKQAVLNEEEYFSGSPQWKRYKSLTRFGYGDEGTLAELVIKRDDETFAVEVERNYKDEITEHRKQNIEELEDGIFYVNMDKARMYEIRERLDELASAKGVIFDMRGYPVYSYDVIYHLLKEPDTVRAWFKAPRIIYPDYENVNFEGYSKGWRPKQPQIKGKIVFLMYGGTISAAETIMSYIEHYKLATIVGQASAGTNGSVVSFDIPGDIKIRFTGAKVVKPDGSNYHLIGIKPTVPVERTIQAVIEGRDEFLEKALEVIKIQ